MSKYADHARNNRELQAILRDIFHTKTSAEWIEFGNEHNTPIAPVNTPQTIMDDPQFQHRFPWYPASQLVADQLPFPLKVEGEDLVDLTAAPGVGEHSVSVLAEFGLRRRQDRRRCATPACWATDRWAPSASPDLRRAWAPPRPPA